jgi:hypothetical protein
MGATKNRTITRTCELGTQKLVAFAATYHKGLTIRVHKPSISVMKVIFEHMFSNHVPYIRQSPAPIPLNEISMLKDLTTQVQPFLNVIHSPNLVLLMIVLKKIYCSAVEGTG